MKAQIYKKNSTIFTIKIGENEFADANARGNVKKDQLFVGDFVEYNKDENLIQSVYERKNLLIRPYVSNIDELFIVIAKVPNPNYIIIDKQILIAKKLNINVSIIINKIDLKKTDSLIKKIYEEYSATAKIIEISAEKNINLEYLLKDLNNKTIVFAGQSGVGKSSIMNKLLSKNLLVGDVSKKIQKGKNTTRIIEMFDINNNRIIDTCGFSTFEINDLDKNEIKKYYPEFLNLSKFCKYTNCNHIDEPECNIKNALINNKINKERYQRYLTLYNEMDKNIKY